MVEFTFQTWVREREKLRKNRERGGPPPWTTDPILARHRFCNVYREHDRVTKWVARNVRAPGEWTFQTDQDFLQWIALARLINEPPTLEALINEGLFRSPIPWKEIAYVVRKLQEDPKRRVFGNAYMVPSRNDADTQVFGDGKIAFICRVCSSLKMPEDTSTRQAFHADLESQYGMGSFLAGQVVADAARTTLLRGATDGQTWAPVGPGAMRGMQIYLHERYQTPVNLYGSISKGRYLEIGKEIMSLLPRRMVEELGLDMHDVASNIMCESSKYWQLKNGLRKARMYP